VCYCTTHEYDLVCYDASKCVTGLVFDLAQLRDATLNKKNGQRGGTSMRNQFPSAPRVTRHASEAWRLSATEQKRRVQTEKADRELSLSLNNFGTTEKCYTRSFILLNGLIT
jgi:hypothetical protein